MSHPPDVATEEEERRTTFLELFFDLVLVFAITQLATLAHEVPHHGHVLMGISQTSLLAVMIWWLWSQFAWLGTSVELSASRPRALMLALTGLMLIAAIALPVGLEPGVSVFGIAYALVKLGALALFRMDGGDDPAHAAAVNDYVPKAAVAPLLVLAGAFLGPGPRLAAWSIAMVMEVGGTLLSGGQAFRISPAHFAERHSLVLIIVLGEAVVALGTHASPTDLTPATIASLLGGFGLVATMWWSYFAWAFGATELWLRGKGRPFAPGDGGAQGRMARDAFTFGHFPLVAGFIAMAVGLKDLAADPLHPWHVEAQVAVSVGLALYLGGFVAVVYRGNGYLLWERLIALALMVATTALSPLPAGLTAALLALQLALTIAVEVRRWSRYEERVRRASASSASPSANTPPAGD